RIGIVFLFEINRAEVDVSGSKIWGELGYALKFVDSRVEITRGLSLETGIDVLPEFRRYLKSEQQKQRGDQSGFLTGVTRSTATFASVCRFPLGQRISTATLLCTPRPKCTRLSLAER